VPKDVGVLCSSDSPRSNAQCGGFWLRKAQDSCRVSMFVLRLGEIGSLGEDMQMHEPQFASLASTVDINVFVMMRYRDNRTHQSLESTIRESLLKYGLVARFAKDRAVRDDVWPNIVEYMRKCTYGIAVFEEINEREFNPNVSMELGFMYAQERKCLLLKDKRMPRLPTDICGRIYKEFDAYDLERTVDERVSEWCERDLGLSQVTRTNVDAPLPERVLFESDVSPSSASNIVYYCQSPDIVRPALDPVDGAPMFELQALGVAPTGVNISMRALFGRAEFRYRVISSSARSNVSFCMIPRQEAGFNWNGPR
jgi:hypothetical protein